MSEQISKNEPVIGNAAPDFSAALLSLLFQRLEVEIAREAVEQAVDIVGRRNSASTPVERIGQILNVLQRSDMQPALLGWAKFNRRSLPALVHVSGEWLLAERTAEGAITFVGGDSVARAPDDAELLTAQVLWLRVGRRPAPVTSFDTLKSKTAKMVLGELFADKRWLWDVMVATVVVNLLAVVTSLYSMQVYDRVVPTFSYSTLWALSMGMLIIMVADWTLKYVRSRMLDSVAKAVDIKTSQRLFEHLLNVRIDVRPRSVGSLAAQASGLETVRAFFSSTIVFALTDLPFAFMFIAFIAVIGGPVAAVYLVLLPLALGLGWLTQLRLRKLSENEMQRSTERQGLLVESIQGAEVIQSLGAGWRFADIWRGMTSDMSTYSIQSKKITSVMVISAGSIGNLAYVLAIVVGVQAIEGGHLTMGGLIASTILGGRILGPVSQAVQILAQWQHVREALSMVDRVMELEKIRADDSLLIAPDKRPESVKFESLRFSYPGSPVVRLDLPGLSFKAGERVLLLGPVGSGKSTLLKVAAGLYRPAEGRVTLGGADLWEVEPQVLVEQVAYLPQDVQLFKGTLRSNLTMVGSISDSRMIEVCGLLGVDRIAADHPRSMEMEVSEGGGGLSGGQRQLIGLARTMLAQPTVWLLDEPTASLDTESEARVIHALKQLIKPDDIVLIATHRSTLLSLATRVILMKGGAVVMDDVPERFAAPRNTASAGEQAS
ncbi:ATP-binding cassette domain-containing protein [Vogesella indigofera]|uniref:ATP-binding cassette domain-containing protein n=1 Tax=Vogesella indigofera TaxID=45465 RepID=A0ABT5I195_VOGIN|nr:ATP-binding cassette domain-containing protein [Vogesella indigofera]MDC7689803.1 ATP-binding cassette domain-containing protein [Vogesella indigofera]